MERHLVGLLAALAMLLVAAEDCPAAGPPQFNRARGKPFFPAINSTTPWEPGLPVRDFEEVCFQNRSRLGGLTEKEARALLEPAHNQPLALHPIPSDTMRQVEFRGLARLKTDWAAETVLRLSFAGGPLTVYFQGEHETVVLVMYAAWPWPQWAAYRTLRRPGEPMPRQEPGGQPVMVLLGTDDGRGGRTFDDTYEFRCQSGRLVLSKGDVRLLTAPFAGKPQAVYLDAGNETIRLRDMAVCRSGPAPDDPLPPRTVVLGRDGPASLDWQISPPLQARFDRLADGGVELAASKTSVPVTASVAIEQVGICDVVVRVDEASVNSGVFLADAGGQPLAGIEFAVDRRNGMMGYGPGRPGGALWGVNLDPDRALAACSGQERWLRLVLAGGALRCWTSDDGRYWSKGIVDVPQQAGAARRVGIYLQKGDNPRKIRVRTLQVRSLDGLMALARPGLCRQAAAAEIGKLLPGNADLGAWQQQVAETTPAGVDPADWRLACGLQLLAANTNSPLGKALAEELLHDGVERLASLESRLALLSDSAVLFDTWNNAGDAQAYAAHWERLGRKVVAECAPAQFDLFRRAFMTASIWTRDFRIEAPSWRLARARALVLLADRRWNELHEWCGQLRFWHQGPAWPAWSGEQTPLVPLLEWIETSSRMLAGRRDRLAAADDVWRHAVNVQLDREAYNVVAELQTATDQGLYDEAARILGGAVLPQGEGLVPDNHDPEGFTSYASAVKLLIERHPKWAAALNARLGAAEKLLFEQTISQGNRPAIEALTLQFYGTPAAAAAHNWLGDRLFSRGDFEEAIDHYRQAWPTADAVQKPQLAARARLAAALSGRRVGKPVQTPVTFGQTQVPAADVERWVADALRRPSDGRAAAAATRSAVADFTQLPAALKAQPWARFEGDVGQQANQVPGPAQEVDWPARQLDVVLADDLSRPVHLPQRERGVMLVANRFQVTAIDARDGRRKWSYSLGGDQGQTHWLSLVPMRPVVVGNRVYARLLPRTGHPEIVCLELETGKRLWQQAANADIVADPLWVHGRLWAIALDPQQAPSAAQAVMIELNVETGEPLERRPLFEVGSQWASGQSCQATVAGQAVLATLAGATFAVDWQGQLLWLRQGFALPAGVESGLPPCYQPPRVFADRLCVVHSSIGSIECLAIDTGRLYWRRSVVGLRRLLDVVDGRAIIETTDGLLALTADSGEPLWRRDMAGLLDGHARAGGGSVLCVQRELLGAGAACPVLVWIDLASGCVKAKSPLWDLRSKRPMVGPLVSEGNRRWCFCEVLDNNGALQPQRNIVELLAAGPPLPPATTADLWTWPVDPGLRGGATLILPGWTILSAEADDRTGIQADWNGRQNVLVIAARERPARIARWLTAAPGAKLSIEVGYDTSAAPKLEVRAEGKVLSEFTPKPQSPSRQWKSFDVDLSPCAGRPVLLSVIQTPPNGGTCYGVWKRLELRGVPGAN